MRKRRTSKTVKALTFFPCLELLTVLLWEQTISVDSSNTPLPASSKVIFWGTFLSVSLALLFWNHLKIRSKNRRRCRIFVDAEKELVSSINQSTTDSQS